MESQYKIIYRDDSGAKGSISLPPFLIENRKELWQAAFQDATKRLQNDVADTPPEALAPMVKELATQHLSYFNEYIDASPLLRNIVESTELAWASTLDETVLKQLGKGDAEVGISELVIAICLIADDQMEPLTREYRRE